MRLKLRTTTTVEPKQPLQLRTYMERSASYEPFWNPDTATKKMYDYLWYFQELLQIE